MKLVGKDIKCIIINAFHKFNKARRNIDMLSVDMEGVLKNQIKPLEMETVKSEMNTMSIGQITYCRKKMNKHDDVAIKTI